MKLLELTSWESFRDLCFTTKGLNVQMVESTEAYDLYGPDSNGLTWHVNIRRPDESADFDANFKALCNKKITVLQYDSDGAPMSRTKVAPSGWNFNLRMIEFRLSTLDSLINKDTAGAELSDAVLKLYDASGVLITDPALQTGCVKSTLDVEPPYDIYVAGGNMKSDAQTAENVYISVIAVPDLPAPYGSKSFVQNINMKYVSNLQGVNADGRAAKWLQYSPTLHTNKLRFQITHPAGYQLGIAVVLETYRQ